jgi:hypothetical protein
VKVELKKRGAVDHELIWGLIGLLALAAAALVPVDRILSDVGYACGLRTLTGYPCPTCGVTRAFVRTARFELGSAFRVNPLATVALLGTMAYVQYALSAVVLRTRRLRLTHLTRRSTRLLLALCAALVLGNWAYMIVMTRMPATGKPASLVREWRSRGQRRSHAPRSSRPLRLSSGPGSRARPAAIRHSQAKASPNST